MNEFGRGNVDEAFYFSIISLKTFGILTKKRAIAYRNKSEVVEQTFQSKSALYQFDRF